MRQVMAIYPTFLATISPPFSNVDFLLSFEGDERIFLPCFLVYVCVRVLKIIYSYHLGVGVRQHQEKNVKKEQEW